MTLTSPSARSVASSRILRFLVGPEYAEYTVHAAIVAHHSPALEAMINGSFKESTDHCVKWQDVDEQVFLSFWRFIYTGNYRSPTFISTAKSVTDEQHTTEEEQVEANVTVEPEDFPPEEPAPVPELEPMEKLDAYAWSAATPTKKKKKERHSAEENERSSRSRILLQDFQNSWKRAPFEPIIDDQQVYERVNSRGETLIHHAKVYILGDRYLMTRLVDLALGKLHEELVNLVIADNQSLDDVVSLLSFCFNNPSPPELRQLVVHYAGCKVESLWKREEFRELVEGSGEFSKALVQTMLLRLD